MVLFVTYCKIRVIPINIVKKNEHCFFSADDGYTCHRISRNVYTRGDIQCRLIILFLLDMNILTNYCLWLSRTNPV